MFQAIRNASSSSALHKVWPLGFSHTLMPGNLEVQGCDGKPEQLVSAVHFIRFRVPKAAP